MNELLIPYNVPVAEDYKYRLEKIVCPGCHIRFSTVTKGKILSLVMHKGMKTGCMSVCVSVDNTKPVLCDLSLHQTTIGLPEVLNTFKSKNP